MKMDRCVGARFIAPGEPDAWHEGAMNRAPTKLSAFIR